MTRRPYWKISAARIVIVALATVFAVGALAIMAPLVTGWFLLRWAGG